MSEQDRQFGKILEWQKEHTEVDNERFKKIDETLKNIPCKEDLREIVRDELGSIFMVKGKTAKSILITTAIVLGAITGIVGSLKIMLAWAGFHLMK